MQSFVMRMNKSLWEFYLESWDTVSKTRQLLRQIIKLLQTNRMIKNVYNAYIVPIILLHIVFKTCVQTSH